MEIKVTGTDGVVRSLSSVAQYIVDGVEATLQDWGNDTAKDARKNHRFGNPYSDKYKARTGNANRSIQADAKGTSVKVWINPDNVTTKEGWVYPALLHDGTRRGIKADPFITRAVKKNIKKLPPMIAKEIGRIMKRTGARG